MATQIDKLETAINSLTTISPQSISPATDDEREALLDILAQEGFGGRENSINNRDDALRIAAERLTWLRDQREEGLR